MYIEDEQMDYEFGFVMLNYLPDFWDLKDQYNLLFNSNNKRLQFAFFVIMFEVQFFYIKNNNNLNTVEDA